MGKMEFVPLTTADRVVTGIGVPVYFGVVRLEL